MMWQRTCQARPLQATQRYQHKRYGQTQIYLRDARSGLRGRLVADRQKETSGSLCWHLIHYFGTCGVGMGERASHAFSICLYVMVSQCHSNSHYFSLEERLGHCRLTWVIYLMCPIQVLEGQPMADLAKELDHLPSSRPAPFRGLCLLMVHPLLIIGASITDLETIAAKPSQPISTLAGWSREIASYGGSLRSVLGYNQLWILLSSLSIKVKRKRLIPGIQKHFYQELQWRASSLPLFLGLRIGKIKKCRKEKKKEENITLDTPLLECGGFSFNVKFREYFSV